MSKLPSKNNPDFVEKYNMNRITIAIPTYNRSSALRNQLIRLGDCRMKYQGLFDLIVCDNASTDNTQQVCDEMQKLGFVFTYKRNEKNVGLVRNLRVCIESVSTEYIWLLGDDDPINPKELATALPLLDNSNYDIIFLNALPLVLNENDSPPGYLDGLSIGRENSSINKFHKIYIFKF